MNKKPLSQCVTVLLVLLPVFLLLGGATYLLHSLNVSKNEELFKARATSSVQVTRRLLEQKVHAVLDDLHFLAGMHEASGIVTRGATREDHRALTLFSDSKRVYDQIRYLDITGMELCRVDRIGNASVVVPRRRLQFKGDRYYAAEGLTLTRGEVYISPLDLNVEHGKIQTPHKPMLRFVAPVFGEQNRRRGMVILNYLGTSLLGILGDMSGDGRMMLLNEQGYWLRGGGPDLDWAFMFEDRRDKTFQNLFPAEWARIGRDAHGQFHTANGLYTFETLCLGDSVQSPGDAPPVHAAGCWKIVSHVPPAILQQEPNAFLFKLAVFEVPVVLLLLLSALVVCRLRTKNLEARQSIIEQNASFARFVPQQFLALLGKGSLRDVVLSSCTQRRVTVLFSDIRSYTKLSEGMTANEVFSLLNDYFVNVSGPIDDNHGFIDIFIGDALMALFPESPEDALRAAISMRRGLRDFNDKQRGKGAKPVLAGYGLHMGEATLGTIGTPKRMQTTAIGDTVNLASRIESATKVYKVDIVISDAVYDALPDPTAFRLRHIDTVRVKGKEEPVALYEVLDADPPELAEAKAKISALLDEGMGLYMAGNFEKAMEVFTACAAACPEDSIPPLYVKRCATMLRIPPGDDWTGISTL